MRLPTDIPDPLHLDLEQPGCLPVDRPTDSRIQRAMIATHRQMMALHLCRSVSDLEAAQDWVAKGFAVLYRQHYPISKP